jgi:hypothetical protein
MLLPTAINVAISFLSLSTDSQWHNQLGLLQSSSEPQSGPEPRQTRPRSSLRFGIVTELDLQYRFRFGGIAEPSKAI